MFSILIFFPILKLDGKDEMSLPQKGEDNILLPDRISQFPLIFNPFPRSKVSLIQPIDSLVLPVGIIDFSFGQRKIDVHVSWDWSMITISESTDNKNLKIPLTLSLDKYIEIMQRKKWHVAFLEVMQTVKKDDSRRGKGANA